MKKFLLILLAILPALAGAQTLKTAAGLALASVKTADGTAIASVQTVQGLTTTAGFLFTENFEGSNTDSQGNVGYDNTGWSSNDVTITPHYNTSPAPLQGSFSCNVPQQNMFISRTVSGTTTGFYCFWYGNFSVLTDFQSSYLEFLDSGATSIVHCETRPSGAVRLHCGANNQDTATGLVLVNTTAYFWLEYENNNGASSEARLYISPTPTKPVTYSVRTVATTTTNVNTIRIRGTSSGAGVGLFDHFIYNNTAIGDNP